MLKARLENMASSRVGSLKDKCDMLVEKIDPLEITQFLRNRELVLSQGAQQEFLACFVAEGKVAEIEKIARESRGKWRRIQAIIGLGYSRYATSLAILQDALGDKDEDVSYFSMIALGHVKTVPAAKILLEFLRKHTSSGYKIASLLEAFPVLIAEEAIKVTRDADPQVRFWAIKILSRLNPADHAKRIMELADDGSDDVRAAACECLGETHLLQAKDILIKRLKDKAWFVRMHAVRALSKILKAECIPQVMEALRDENWLVRDSVKKAIADNIESALPVIEELMREGSPSIRNDCVDALEDSGYLVKLIDDIISQGAEKRQLNVRLLKGLVSASAHSGLESVIKELGEERQKAILKIIADMDGNLAQHIEKIIQGKAVEF